MLRKTIIGAFLSLSFAASGAENLPAVSVTAPNGQKSIILGSLHVGIEGMKLPSKDIFKDSKRFVMEHQGNFSKDEVSQLIDDEFAPWAKELSNNEVETFKQRARCAGYPEENLLMPLRLTAPVYANQIAYTVCGHKLYPSREMWLKIIKPEHLKTDYLESDEDIQLRRTRAFSIEGNAKAQLSWILSRDPFSVLSGIRDAINTGNYDSVLNQLNNSYVDKEFATAFNNIMIYERNEAWMPKLKSYLDDGHSVIIVGTAHLPGKNGLIELLNKEGYITNNVMIQSEGN